MAKHKNHFCGDNDGECTCKCYDSGWEDGRAKLLTELEEKLPKKESERWGIEMSRARGEAVGFNSCLNLIRSIINLIK